MEILVKALILITALVACNYTFALQLDNGDNKTIYFNDAGKKLDAIEAFKRAMADEKILKCDYIEAVGNQRTGKVTLKKKK